MGFPPSWYYYIEDEEISPDVEDYLDEAFRKAVSKENKKCECGKVKHNFTSHANFCPLYDSEVDGTGSL